MFVIFATVARSLYTLRSDDFKFEFAELPLRVTALDRLISLTHTVLLNEGASIKNVTYKRTFSPPPVSLSVSVRKAPLLTL